MTKRIFFAMLLLLLLVPFMTALAQPESINTALADLNTRLGTTLTLNDINWRWSQNVYDDASLGCPQEGQTYAAVQTTGYQYLFFVENTTYDYRADQAGNVFFCTSFATNAVVAPTAEPTLPPATGGTITLSNANSIEVIGIVQREPGAFGSALAWLPGTELIAVAGGALENAITSKVLIYNASNLTSEPVRLQTDSPVTALAGWAAGGEARLAIGTQSGMVGIVTLVNGEPEVLPLSAVEGATAVNDLTFSPGGDLVAAAYGVWDSASDASSNLVAIWTSDNAAVRTLPTSSASTAIAFSPDGSQIATGDGLGFIRLLDSESGAVTSEFRLHTSAVRDIAFSPDGTQIASGAMSGTARVWDISTEILVAEFDNVTDDYVLSVAFSPDGSLLATAGGNPNALTRDNGIRLWNVTGLALAGGLIAHTELVSAIAFDSAGTRLASVSLDGTLRVWGTASAG
jgi:WD40 repeat protein